MKRTKHQNGSIPLLPEEELDLTCHHSELTPLHLYRCRGCGQVMEWNGKEFVHQIGEETK